MMHANINPDEPSITFIREGTGLDYLDKVPKILEPWQVLFDLGHYSSYNYNTLSQVLSEFKEISERVMAKTLL
jgi:hypothetical protein